VATGLAFPPSALADTTVDFEQFSAGTVITSQYADAGGSGQGVVFGPLPGGIPGEGLHPVIRTPPAGEAQSGTRVADIATCPGCEFYTPRTTGTLGAPRSALSVYVGYLGPSGVCTALNPDAVSCAVVRLRAYDTGGNQVAEASVRVTRGAGVHSLLSVSTPTATIVGFEISGRPLTDDSKPIAIDDLTFKTPSNATPDFTLNPAVTDLTIEQGGSATDAITIGRLGGSSGDIAMSASGLPPGVGATFSPNPAPATQTVLTLTADSNADPTMKPVTVTGTPQSPSAGPSPRSFTLNLTVQRACPQVRTAQELVDRLAAGFKCIFVVGKIDLLEILEPKDPVHPVTGPDSIIGDPRSFLVIPDGVTLMGGRSPTSSGGILEVPRRPKDKDKNFVLNVGSSTHITGLRIEGYNHSYTKDVGDKTRGIAIVGSENVIVDKNEISQWPHSGVYVSETHPATRPRISENFIHNNVECNEGQGVQVGGGGVALVDHNVFNYNRHDIGASGHSKGYTAHHNLSLTPGPTCYPDDIKPDHYNQHYDIHGTGDNGYGGRAGNLVEIRDNTIRGAQKFYVVQRRPAFMLRGVPDDKAVFAGNAVFHAKARDQGVVSSKGAVQVKGLSIREGLQLATRHKLVISDTKTCLDTAAELAVGDFNGDGRDDVFQAVGTLWVYSPSGRREWFVLRDSELRLRKLGLGDFNGDGKTDVLTQDGARWLISDGGTAPFARQPVGSNIDIKNYRFGDFDGDRRTDIFRANGKRFFFSSAATTAWQPLAASRFEIGKLRLGDFDGDGKTDVFSLANNQWSVSFGGATSWTRLNRKLSSNLGKLAFADFDGDGETDVARTNGGKWEVSLGGATPWRTLAFGRSEPLDVGMLFGDFTGDGSDDVLQHGKRKNPSPAPPCWERANGTMRFQSFDRFRLSSKESNRRLEPWSFADMR
jgi:FG-GAP-like repeat/Right handed beta helix region